MEKTTFIGIDISKSTVDICINEEENYTFHCIENETKALKKFFKQIRDKFTR